MEEVLTLLIPIAGLVAIVRIVVDGRVKRRLAETHASEDLVRALSQADEAYRRQSTLKWALVLGSTGLAFALIEVLDLGVSDPGAYGLLLAAAGIGLLLNHFLQRRDG